MFFAPKLYFNCHSIPTSISCNSPKSPYFQASRAIYLKNGLVFTTGFTKHSERQYSLRAPGHLDDPIVMVELDTSNGVMFPMYDPDANLIYLCGKGSVTERMSQSNSNDMTPLGMGIHAF